MSPKSQSSLRAAPEGVAIDREQKAPPDIVIEEDEDLAGAIESWFEKGEEYDRRYGGADNHAS